MRQNRINAENYKTISDFCYAIWHIYSGDEKTERNRKPFAGIIDNLERYWTRR